MPLCQVNIAGDRLAAPEAARDVLDAALRGHSPEAPVVVLLHGYKFSPSVAAHDPHTHILSLDPRPCPRAVSWPRQLGLGQPGLGQPGLGQPGLGQPGGPEPLCLAVGWEARGTLWQAYRRAAAAGAGLAELVGLVRALRPGTSVQALAHSLGARVVLSALPHLEPGAMDRAVLLAAAEMRNRAARALDTPAGRALEVLNVASRENELYDALLEWMIAPHAWGDRALGRGFGRRAAPRRLDLRIDDAGHRAALAGLGFRIPEADRRFCHWSVYLRAGLFDLYRAVLAGGMRLEGLASALPAPATERSRLVQRPRAPLSLPHGTAS